MKTLNLQSLQKDLTKTCYPDRSRTRYYKLNQLRYKLVLLVLSVLSTCRDAGQQTEYFPAILVGKELDVTN